VVVFEILPSHVKTFHYRPQYSQLPHHVVSHAVRRLCVGSESELRRPRFVAVTTYRAESVFDGRYLKIYHLYIASVIALIGLTLAKAPFRSREAPREGFPIYCLYYPYSLLKQLRRLYISGTIFKYRPSKTTLHLYVVTATNLVFEVQTQSQRRDVAQRAIRHGGGSCEYCGR